tara:strand:- start:1094 stop:1507 length:414 start_codon:yes stop_codon:yes gene_type:complete
MKKKTHYKHFNNAGHKLIHLNGKDRVLLDYMCEWMDTQNRITLDGFFIEKFIAHIARITDERVMYSKKQVTYAIEKMASLELIFHSGKKGVYFVSPKHFANGTLGQNKKNFLKVQKLLEDTTSDKTLYHIPRKFTDC